MMGLFHLGTRNSLDAYSAHCSHAPSAPTWHAHAWECFTWNMRTCGPTQDTPSWPLRSALGAAQCGTSSPSYMVVAHQLAQT